MYKSIIAIIDTRLDRLGEMALEESNLAGLKAIEAEVNDLAAAKRVMAAFDAKENEILNIRRKIYGYI
jgi:hypothetical protein